MPKLLKRKGRRKFRTGFCQNGWCEGLKPKDANGRALPTCEDFERCPCECHAILDEIFEKAGIERVLQQSSYQSPPREYWMPGDPEPDSNGLFIPDGTNVPATASDAPTVPPGHATTPPRPRTPTGRRPKGTLESEVLTVCQDFDNGVYDWMFCTPKLVSESIGHFFGTECPSTGAVQAIWDRWKKLEFATYEKKPVRFTRFLVEDNSEANLDRMKRASKRSKSRIARGIR